MQTRFSASSPAPEAANRGAGFWRIGAWAGLLLVGALCAVGPLELSSASPAPMGLLAADAFEPGSSIETGINGASGLQVASAANDEDFAQLFGMDTEPVTAGTLVDKWRRTAADITKDLEVIAQCHAGNPCPAPARKLIALSLEGASRGGRARVGLINRAIDLAISPMSDETQWGVSDHWSDPFETLQSNFGDCEDYAIVKYAALLSAGLSKDAVKIVVLRNRWPNEDHAVAAVRVDQQWLILDDRTLTLVRDTDVTRAIPEFVLDDQGVRRFVRNGQTLRAAGAVLDGAPKTQWGGHG